MHARSVKPSFVLRRSMPNIAVMGDAFLGVPEMATLTSLQSRLAKHLAYRKTLAELRAMPHKVALDLEVYGCEKEIAYRAIYG